MRERKVVEVKLVCVNYLIVCVRVNNNWSKK